MPSTQEVAPISDEEALEGTSNKPSGDDMKATETKGSGGRGGDGKWKYVVLAALFVAIGLAVGLGVGLSSKNDEESSQIVTTVVSSEIEDCLDLPVAVGISCRSPNAVDCVEAEEVLALEDCVKPFTYEFSIYNYALVCTKINQWIANVHEEMYDLLPKTSLEDQVICPGEQVLVEETVEIDLCLGTQYLTSTQINVSSTDDATCYMMDTTFYANTPRAICDLEIDISCFDRAGFQCQEETICVNPDSCIFVVRNVGPSCATLSEWNLEVVSGVQLMEETNLLDLAEGRTVCPGETISVDPGLSYDFFSLEESFFTMTATVAATPPTGTPCFSEFSIDGEIQLLRSPLPDYLQPDYFLDKYIDSIFIVMTHNSLALPGRVFAHNNNYGLAKQFQDGVRGFNLDLYEREDGSITTSHGVGLTEDIQYDPRAQVNELISELSYLRNEFILVQLQNELKTEQAVEDFCGWWGGLLIKNFDPNTPLADYINAGQRVLLVSAGGPLIDPSIGIHETADIIVENQYEWMNPCTNVPDLRFRRGPNQGRSCKMFNMFSGVPAGDPMRSRIANAVSTALSNIGEFLKQPYADGMVNIVLVDFYDVGLNSILQVQHVMRNADENGLQVGQECITLAEYPDAQCSGDLRCCSDATCCANGAPATPEPLECSFDDPTFISYLEGLANNPRLLELLNNEIREELASTIADIPMNAEFRIWHDIFDFGVCNLGMHLDGKLRSIRNLDDNFLLKGARVIDTSGTDLSIMKAVLQAQIQFVLKPTYVSGSVSGSGDCGPVDVDLSGNIGGYFGADATISFTLSADLCLEGADLQFESVQVSIYPTIDRLTINPSLDCDFPWYAFAYEFVCDNVWDLALDGIMAVLESTSLADRIANEVLGGIKDKIEDPIKDAVVKVLDQALDDGSRTCPIPSALSNPCIDPTTELGAYGNRFSSIGCHNGNSFVLCAPAHFDFGWIYGSTDQYLDSAQYNACCDDTPQAQLTYAGPVRNLYGLNGQHYKQRDLKCA